MELYEKKHLLGQTPWVETNFKAQWPVLWSYPLVAAWVLPVAAATAASAQP